MLRDLLTGGIMFGLILAGGMISFAIYSMTFNVTAGILTGTALTNLNTINTAGANAFITYFNFMPIVAIALVGGIAMGILVLYVLRQFLSVGGQ